MSLDECAELLSDFGLTFNQAKAYIAVVQLGLASVSEVSRISKVRGEDVYRMLPKLEELGLIEKMHALSSIWKAFRRQFAPSLSLSPALPLSDDLGPSAFACACCFR